MGMLIKSNKSEKNTLPTLNGLDDIFNHLMNHFSSALMPELMPAAMTVPGMELDVQDKQIVAKLPLPGYTSEEMDIEVVGDYLTVRAHHKTNVADKEEARYLRRERSFACYEESVKLPVHVLADQTKADYVDGVLTITLPRDLVEKPALHTVKVQ